ncbi:MAG: preprotein translocase subunit SecG [Anaerolineae bacterium]
MSTYLYIVQIILGIALTAVILLEVRSSGLGAIFGSGETSIYRTRRGVEKTLFIITIVLAILFFLVAILNAVVIGPT